MYKDTPDNVGRFAAIGVGGLLLLIVLMLTMCSGVAGYVGHSVEPNEIGIRFRENKLVDVVGPGRYTEFPALFVGIQNVKVEGVPFCAEDAEVLTSDQQAIGLKVCGTVLRPSLENAQIYLDKWDEYRAIYTSDDPLVTPIVDGAGNVTRPALMESLGQQAMKVCVGDRTFEQAAVGAARDELRRCVDERVSELASPYGLTVENVVVPNVVISEEVRTMLDRITQEKFQTDLENQQALRAEAQANRELAEQQGQIRVSQGRIQEQQRQRAVTAELEQQALESELQVIVAQKANDLREAQLALEVSEAELAVEQTRSQAELADVFLLAGLYQDNPAYLQLLIQKEWAAAWAETDKVIVPAGTAPSTIINPDGVDTVIPVQP